MAERIEDLIRAETRLTRSFAACVVIFLASTIWLSFIARRTPTGDTDPAWVGTASLLLQFGCYVWFAFAAGAAAKLLGDPGWKYIVWILAAPFLARIPIPIVSTLIAVSPLSIKFLLGGQLQTAIREEGIAAIR